MQYVPIDMFELSAQAIAYSPRSPYVTLVHSIPLTHNLANCACCAILTLYPKRIKYTMFAAGMVCTMCGGSTVCTIPT